MACSSDYTPVDGRNFRSPDECSSHGHQGRVIGGEEEQRGAKATLEGGDRMTEVMLGKKGYLKDTAENY